MADWVSVMRSPSASFFSSPPASSPTYVSPSSPEVRMDAFESFGNE
jgi:hypothetical protein